MHCTNSPGQIRRFSASPFPGGQQHLDMVDVVFEIDFRHGNKAEFAVKSAQVVLRTLDDADAYVERIMNTENLYYWVARTRADNTPVGVISFLKRHYLDHFDIGFALLPQYQGLGYAHEGARAVLDLAKANPAYETILATTIPENTSSIQLLERLGLTFQKAVEENGEMLWVYGMENGE